MADVNKTVDVLYNARSAKAIKDTEKLAKETDNLDKNVKNVNQGLGDQEGILGKAAKGALAYIAGFVGIAGVALAMQTITRDIKEQVVSASDLQDALQELIFLQGTATSQETRERVSRLAPLAGRNPADVARFLQLLESGTGARLTPEERIELANQALETSITAPETDLATTGKLFAAVAGASRVRDFNAIQNVLKVGIDKAFSTQGAFATSFAQPLVALSSAGVGLGEATGLFAASTLALEGETARAATGLTSSFLSLTAPVSGPAKAISKKFGLGANFTDNLFTLAKSNISDTELVELVGKENVILVKGLMNQARDTGDKGLRALLDTTIGAFESTEDLTSDEVKLLFRSDPIARSRFELAQAESANIISQATGPQAVENLEFAAFKLRFDAALRNAGVNAVRRAIANKAVETAEAFGFSVEAAGRAGTAAIFGITGVEEGVEILDIALNLPPPLPSGPGGISGSGTTIIQGDVINNGGTKINDRQPEREAEGGPDPDNGGARQ